MANSFNNHLPRRVAVYYWKLKPITAKIYKTASSIRFIKKNIIHGELFNNRCFILSLFKLNVLLFSSLVVACACTFPS